MIGSLYHVNDIIQSVLILSLIYRVYRLEEKSKSN